MLSKKLVELESVRKVWNVSNELITSTFWMLFTRAQ